MPTMIFDHNYTEKQRRILQTTRRITCDNLKISESDCTISARRARIGNEKHMALMNRLPCGNFVFIVNDLVKPMHMIMPAFCHEMVHVKQYLTGQMKDVRDGVEWCGTFFPYFVANSPSAYEHLPWEKEAFGKMWMLARLSFLALSSEDKMLVAKEGNLHEAAC